MPLVAGGAGVAWPCRWTLELRVLEHRRFEAMTLQQFVEFSSVALGERRRLGHVATRDFQQPHEVVALELLAGFLEWREHAGVLAQRALHQRRRDDARRRKRD